VVAGDGPTSVQVSGGGDRAMNSTVKIGSAGGDPVPPRMSTAISSSNGGGAGEAAPAGGSCSSVAGGSPAVGSSDSGRAVAVTRWVSPVTGMALTTGSSSPSQQKHSLSAPGQP